MIESWVGVGLCIPFDITHPRNRIVDKHMPASQNLRPLRFDHIINRHVLTDYQKYIDQALAAIFGGLLAWAWGVDLLAALLPGLTLSVPWLGAFLTGVLIVLPSAVLHELFELLKLWRRDVVRALVAKTPAVIKK